MKKIIIMFSIVVLTSCAKDLEINPYTTLYKMLNAQQKK